MNGPASRSVARAAALIAVLTVLARVTGFGRILAFSRTVGSNCLGDTYQVVNTVPNIVFEVVAGGALASLVIPLLARAADAGDRDEVARTSSALLTWALLLLVPLAAAVALLADPIAHFLLRDSCAAAPSVGASMLRVFAPQIPLYGVSIVLTGVLQAHRRFAGPALGPLVSSLVVIAAYVLYSVQAPGPSDIDSLTTAEELTLSLGTTLGVVGLTLPLLGPLALTRVRLRPAVRFPPGIARRALHLAGAGVATLVAQQAAVFVALKLGVGAGVPAGDYVNYTYAQTVYLLPWGVLAVPIATSVFPQLAARHGAGDEAGYARGLAGSLRALLLVCLLGVAALEAAAVPVARVIVEGTAGASVGTLAAGIAAFAPGLVGYGLFALLSRALYARGNARTTAYAAVAGWMTVVVADVVLANLLAPTQRVLALGLGNTIGMSVLGLLLTLTVHRRAGRAALAGVGRALAAALAAATLAALAGRLVSVTLRGGGALAALGQGILVGMVVLVVFGAVAGLLARDDLRRLLRRKEIASG